LLKQTLPPELVQRSGTGLRVVPDVAAPLLAALEDPNRFAAAHLELMHVPPTGTWHAIALRTWAQQPFPRVGADGRAFAGRFNGLGVRLSPRWSTRSSGPFGPTVECDATFDTAAELPSVRDQWHRRLDVEVFSAPYWPVVAALAGVTLLGAMPAARRWRSHVRRSRGLCIACGYDIRATPDRCPECGRDVA
jgi:hypothetical protein